VRINPNKGKFVTGSLFVRLSDHYLGRDDFPLAVGLTKGAIRTSVLSADFESFPGGFAASSTGAFPFPSRGKQPNFARVANHFSGDDDSL
jgi:hypothetical protein